MPGGNLLIGQSGGPTPVINASLAGVLNEAKKMPEIEKIYGLKNGIEGALKKEVYDLNQEPEDLVNQLPYTPASVLGSCRHKLTKDGEYEQLLELFKTNNIRYFVYIGGNDSMDTCHKISKLAQQKKYDMQVIGIPKTIDNDLPVTDHCPGFGSAARFIALSTVESGRDLESMKTFDDVAIFEIMGRNAGWLTAASALGKRCEKDAPHLIYLPEVTFNEDKFLEDVKAVHDKLGYVYVALSEGIRDKNGEFIGAKDAAVDAFGHKAISLSDGPGAYLTKLIIDKTGLKARCNRPGTIQRALSSLASPVDVQEAFQAGAAAVKYFAEGISDVMVTLERGAGSGYVVNIGKTALENAANVEKFMPGCFINEEGNFVTPAFYDYCLPLLGEAIPGYARLVHEHVILK
ncbi:MAG: 6-phosphofructokinase [Peptococcaceae bacterium]